MKLKGNAQLNHRDLVEAFKLLWLLQYFYRLPDRVPIRSLPLLSHRHFNNGTQIKEQSILHQNTKISVEWHLENGEPETNHPAHKNIPLYQALLMMLILRMQLLPAFLATKISAEPRRKNSLR